jgi:predicted AlkP superfamily phosphohydrolase/phosphomutase/tetratricopeptide (TPR) repeat protein
VTRRWLAATGIGLAALACRKEPAPAAAPKPSAGTGASATLEDVAARTKRAPGGATPVIWLGLDGLDWELLDRLSAEGKMPNWKRLTAEGSTARLKSFAPMLSPVVWTTLATGVGPDVHRVLDFQEIDPATGQRVPISGRSRAVPAIWNVASAKGKTVGVVGWWATNPAEEVRGFFVSDATSPILFDGLPKQGVAFPAALAPGVEQIVGRESRVGSDDVAAFVAMPASEVAAALAAGDPADKLVLLSRAIAATRVESRIARELYDRHLPDLMMLYLEGTDVIGHLFASWVPPKMDCVSDADFARYRGTVDAYYALVDRVIGQWMRRAAEDGATLVVNSDHGFRWGADRSCDSGSLDPATALSWHRLDGVFAAWGARVRPSPQRGEASVFDVEPTVAALLGLPVDRNARGSPLRSVFPDLADPPREDLATVSVRRLESAPMSEKETSEYAKKLMALGYLSGSSAATVAVPAGGNAPGLTEGAWDNLGLYLFYQGGDANATRAEEAYKKSLAASPGFASPKFHLAMLYRSRKQDRPAASWLFQALEGAPPKGEEIVFDWALFYENQGRKGPELEVLERGAKLYPDSERVNRALGVLRFQNHDCRGADEVLARFESGTGNPETLNTLALVRACLGRREDAVRLFRRSLAIRPDQETVVRSLALLEGGAAAGDRKGS